MATALARPILAASDRSILPGPRVITIIWAMPAITMKTASASAEVSMAPAPWPCVTRTATTHMPSAAAKDQIQAAEKSLRIAPSRAAADQRPRRQHDDQDHAVGTDLPVLRNLHEGEQRRGRPRQGQATDN